MPSNFFVSAKYVIYPEFNGVVLRVGWCELENGLSYEDCAKHTSTQKTFIEAADL